jgi:hypothetical protein
MLPSPLTPTHVRLIPRLPAFDSYSILTPNQPHAAAGDAEGFEGRLLQVRDERGAETSRAGFALDGAFDNLRQHVVIDDQFDAFAFVSVERFPSMGDNRSASVRSSISSPSASARARRS